MFKAQRVLDRLLSRLSLPGFEGELGSASFGGLVVPWDVAVC